MQQKSRCAIHERKTLHLLQFAKKYITHNKEDDAQCNKENGAPTTNKMM